MSMKRTRIRRRSRTNSRPWENPSLRQRYMDEHDHCELSQWLWRETRCADEPHHLFGGRLGRWDLWGNLLAVCRESHDWCELNKTKGRVLCLYVKDEKGEIDFDELRQAAGQDVRGWIQTDRVIEACRDSWIEELRIQLLSVWGIE